MVVLKTKRLLLRHFHVGDQQAMIHVFCDAEVMRFSTGVRTPEWVRDWIVQTLENQFRNWGFGQLAVVQKDSRETIGICGLNYYPDIEGKAEVEIGYRLARRHWGQGYATEAASAVRDHAFNDLCLGRLIALIDADNTASIRVVEKLSMHYEKDVMLPDYTYPDRMYVIERTEL